MSGGTGGKARLSHTAIKRLGLVACVIAIAIPLAAVYAGADVISGDNVRIDFRGSILPKALPRSVPAPVALHVSGRVDPVGAARPAALERMTIQINRHAAFTTYGLPRCPIRKLRSTNSAEALAACGNALVGSGHFTSHIDIPEQAPFPSWGRVLAFNAVKEGRQAIVLQIFGRHPAPTSTLLSAAIDRSGPAGGEFGPDVTVEMPRIGDEWGYVNGFSLTFRRRYRYHGKERSVVSATCPAPPDLGHVPFKAARGTFELADGEILTRTLGGSCRVAN